MSDRRDDLHRGHDHDPDPAALDELRRAFADDPNGPVDRGERRSESAADDDPAAAVTTGRLDAVPPTAPTPAAEDPGTQPSDRHAPPDETVDDDHLVDGEDAIGRDDLVDRDDVVDDASPAILSADLPDVDRPDGDEPFDVVIVEQEPLPSAEPTPPRIIRIDDYSGSSERPTPPSDVDPPAGAATARSTVPGEPITPTPEPDVISIADDDLPDAVYVEGSLDRDGSGTIVFIEDDQTGDTLAPESERDLRRGIEPRMRERRVAVKRAQGRRRLKRLGIVAAGVLLIVGVLAVLGSPLFAVRADDVRIFNAVYSDTDELREIVDDVVGTPVLRVDTTDVEDRIEQIPWVEAASVRTDFPHGLVIEIREREAISTYQGPDGRFRVLDREGRVLDVLDLYPYAYVLIGGPDSVDLEPGEFAPQGYAAASELAKNLTAAVRGRVTFIEVNADGSRLVMTLDDGSTVFFGEARDLLAKLVRLEAVLTNGQEREPGLIDVSTADVTR